MLQGIAIVYAIAFVSLAVQIEGLYGARGILPAESFVQMLTARFGDSAWREQPTLFLWLGAGDAMLKAVCWAGAGFAGLLLAGVLPTLSAIACWVLYFSLFQVGRVFLSFQWDILLLEAGFLAIFLAPLRLRQRVEYDPEPPRVAIWMLRWLLFRLMFASGVVKLLSDDPVWWNLTALEYHYWTQPLPTWSAWLASQAPAFLQRASCALMFVIELGVPWFIFGTRRMRLTAFGLLVLLQVLIAATGNYTFFNLLTVVLCFSLLDDDALGAVRARVWPRGPEKGVWPGEEPRFGFLRRASFALSVAAALPLAVAGGALMVARFAGFSALPAPVASLVALLQPLHVTSSYGLFSVMTKERREVVLEGSLDGHAWREYEMRWKPGDVTKTPMFVAPHQPRLDWQMWFAALGDWRRSPWLVEVERRLLDGSPDVLALFAADPFGGEKPKHVRAQLYDYRFTSFAEWEETGAWWKRKYIGPYSPPISK
jgi:lipase maturation factor 1